MASAIVPAADLTAATSAGLPAIFPEASDVFPEVFPEAFPELPATAPAHDCVATTTPTPASATASPVAAADASLLSRRLMQTPPSLTQCAVGVRECDGDKHAKAAEKAKKAGDPTPACASYDGTYEDPQRLTWVVAVAAVRRGPQNKPGSHLSFPFNARALIG